MKTIIPVALLLFFQVSTSLGEEQRFGNELQLQTSGPSLEKTTDWIKSKVANHNQTHYFDGCIYTYKTNNDWYEIDKEGRIISFNLKSIKSTDISLSQDGLYSLAIHLSDVYHDPKLNTNPRRLTSRQILSKSEYAKYEVFCSQEYKKVYFYFDNLSIAERVLSAFEHASKLCGAELEDEPF